MLSKAHTLPLLFFAIGLLVGVPAAVAYQDATSELLLPYFEVDLTGTGPTTFFSVVNTSGDPVEVVVQVHSNWGVKILRSSILMDGNEVRAVDLGDWLIHGKLPERQLGVAELGHCQAALTGQRTPGNDLYYADEIEHGRAVGYVTLRTRTGAKVLFGDYFLVDKMQDAAQGEMLIDIASTSRSAGLCKRHGLRFLSGDEFDEGTEVVIWTGQNNSAFENPYFPERRKMKAELTAYRQSGESIEEGGLRLVPLQVLKISELNLASSFGWLDLLTDSPVYVAVRYSADRRFSVGLQTSCLPSPSPAPPVFFSPAARLEIETSTNNMDADTGLGPELQLGDAVSWLYLIRNTGTAEVFDITVRDDQLGLICHRDSLAPGQGVTCETHGIAVQGSYSNLGSVKGRGPGGEMVSASDPSHYFVELKDEYPSIDVELSANGLDADAGPGPELASGESVNWTYVVRNTGDVSLTDVIVTDDKEGSICDKSSLAPGESMTCQTTTSAQAGQYSTLATATGTSPQGVSVSDYDRGHYYCPH